MAIQKSLVLKSNLGDQQNVLCYIRIKNINATKTNVACTFDLIRKEADYVIESRQFYLDLNAADYTKNIWVLAYEHLKTLPEFAGATDC
jgi:hypothetical protein